MRPAPRQKRSTWQFGTSLLTASAASVLITGDVFVDRPIQLIKTHLNLHVSQKIQHRNITIGFVRSEATQSQMREAEILQHHAV